MKLPKIASIMLTLALAAGCRTAGPPKPKPIVRLVRPPPCVLVRPPSPGPVLLGAPRCEAGSECPALAEEQTLGIWAYIEGLEDWALGAWARCGPDKARRDPRAGEGGGSQGDRAAP